MKLKLSVPSSSELESAYHSLINEKPLSNEIWIHYSKMCRFDPRIAEAWIKKMARDWEKIPANTLREINLKSNSPATLGVLLEQIEDYLIKKENKKLFQLWKLNVLYQTPKCFGESFLIGVHPFASKKMLSDAEYPLRSFQEWGFSGSDIFVNKAMSQSKIKKTTGLKPDTRMRKLKEFLAECRKNKTTRFTIEDYLTYFNHLVSRRIAQLDLQSTKGIRAHGQTRSRFYTLT